MKSSYAGLQKLLLCGLMLFASTPAQAQITPDNTLGAESSRLTPNVTINAAAADRIDGGATRGSNLFHSFSQFNINNAQRVYFGNPTVIKNIISRVTGGQASNILGVLGVNGGANLFLINPNGIIFGQNAELDVRGSFIGTTANALKFGEQGNFSATNPAAPPLLTVNPSALLYNQINPGGITNRAQLNNSGSPEQGSRFLVGGNITFDRGGVFVVGNRLELGGLAGAGVVGLSGSGNELQLNFPAGVPRADVVVQNNAAAFATKGGAIIVNARNLNLSGNSFINTTLLAGEGNPGSPAGDVVINATGAVTVDGNKSFIISGDENSLGDSGNITVDAQSIGLNNQSRIDTTSQKNRGSIRLNAIEDVTLDGRSLISTFGTPTSIGNSGDITVNARNINLSNGSAINSGIIGQGRSGRTTLKATDAIALASGSSIYSSSIASAFGGTNSEASGDIEIAARTLSLDGQKTSISSTNLDEGRAGDIRITTDDSIKLNQTTGISSATRGQGDAGNIQLQTRVLTLSNASYIQTATAGQGNSGNLLVNASDSVTLSGTGVVNQPDGEKIAGSNLSTGALGSGNSGQITINTGRLSIGDGGNIITSATPTSGRGGDLTINASDLVEFVGATPNDVYSAIDTSTSGSGNAGNVTINTGRLSIRSGAVLAMNTFSGSTGQGGNLTVNASDAVELVGASPVDSFNSVLRTTSAGSGNAGRISIDTRRLSLSNGALIIASTLGSGRGGNININATDSIEIAANPADTDTPDGIFTSTVGSGDAGDLSLRTQRLSVRNGGAVTARTIGGTGRGGNVNINASDSVEVVGISNDGQFPSLLSVRSQGEGAAGNISVNSPRLRIQDRGAVTAESSTVDGGNINLNTAQLLLRRNGAISATAGGAQAAGNGGNIRINSDFIIAVLNENSDISANAFQGRGGNVQISTQGIFGIQARSKLSPQTSDITASSELGVSGQVSITEPNVQPDQGLVELPGQILDASNQIAQACPNGATAKRPLGEFVVTGRGSLPPNPLELLAGTTSLSPLASVDGEAPANRAPQTSSSSATTAIPNPIVEAQGWVKTADGKIVLVAFAPQATPSATTTQATCAVFK